MSKSVKPVLAITMGDPAGIGPEVALRALADESVYRQCRPLLVGDLGALEQAMRLTGAALKVNSVTRAEDGEFRHGTVDLYDMGMVDTAQYEVGRVAPETGEAAFQYVLKAIELAQSEEVDGTVTGPIHKEAIHQAGHYFSGHTEIYAHYTKTERYAMLLVEENLRVIHVSTHVSLRQACDLVRKERILEVIELLNEACLGFEIEKPRIAVAGLNPHASDGGLFGDEEEKEIIPAVEEARARGMDVIGPEPADTLFSKARGGDIDGCVAMYHDQGHIPFKVLGFQWDGEKRQMKSVRGVNITLGLPIIRVSVDHGTAMDIAGKGTASPDAMRLALAYATKMARQRRKALSGFQG
ncbi:MAG: 4-hydroxythreonine-4-phosphate dehydrogenase PdxA [Opitutae bacterium]|nr:4-hydroxythreonine-4-phosphate dehydrogenase PdxA [Opitutae bacterium]